MSKRDVARLKAEVQQRRDGKRVHVPNPHNKGSYHYFIEALKSLGANRRHSRAVVIGRFRELTNTPETRDETGKTFWQRWTKGDEGNDHWGTRFDRNAEVLQRVPRPGVANNTPYGLRLLEVGTKVLGTAGIVVDIVKDRDGQRAYRLNTNSSLPVNEFRTRREASRKAKVTQFYTTAQIAQRGRCPICRRDDRPLCVDHCHRKGHLRGVICRNCNAGLGFFSDSRELLLRAAEYLPPTKPRRTNGVKGRS
ncbi:MAG TPA: endonuclease domain-containing protein [Tepidisphaeraceae bacterium]|nr:endonuclease domain-containing protein [Tepidisphaeraceae bacterium]